MNASTLMTSNPVTITGADPISRAAALMRSRNVGMLPVVSDLTGQRLIGVITDRDIVVRFVAPGHGSEALVREHMTRDPLVTVTPDATEHEIAEKMKRYQVRRLPVVDERGAVMGIVAQADLALNVGPQDPVLVEQTLESISRPGALTH